MHAHAPPVQVKFSLPAPVGHPHVTVLQPFVSVPHAVPSAGGDAHAIGAQHTFGFGVVLQNCPPGQVHVIVEPQPSLNVPHGSPPGWPGPPGTLPQL